MAAWFTAGTQSESDVDSTAAVSGSRLNSSLLVCLTTAGALLAQASSW
jgi:hypothetical protein